MQTFLPYPDIVQSASVLDVKRLGKQRLEAMQILRTLRGESVGWATHPAVAMWQGYERALEQYMRACIVEWINRGYANTMAIPRDNPKAIAPHWFGDDEFHRSHQSNLLRKAPEHYQQYFPGVPNDLPYIWPIGKFTKGKK